MPVEACLVFLESVSGPYGPMACVTLAAVPSQTQDGSPGTHWRSKLIFGESCHEEGDAATKSTDVACCR